MTDQMPPALPSTAATLGLEPHPEGGYFHRYYTSSTPVETANGQRPSATAIHYLLTPGERSAWHVVSSDELWLWHGPGRLTLRLGGTGEAPAEADDVTAVTLGPDVAAGDVAQCLVPAGTWQAADLAGDVEALMSCVVSPGFDFQDWRLA